VADGDVDATAQYRDAGRKDADPESGKEEEQKTRIHVSLQNVRPQAVRGMKDSSRGYEAGTSEIGKILGCDLHLVVVIHIQSGPRLVLCMAIGRLGVLHSQLRVVEKHTGDHRLLRLRLQALFLEHRPLAVVSSLDA
jgi:hypothetical protein